MRSAQAGRAARAASRSARLRPLPSQLTQTVAVRAGARLQTPARARHAHSARTGSAQTEIPATVAFRPARRRRPRPRQRRHQTRIGVASVGARLRRPARERHVQVARTRSVQTGRAAQAASRHVHRRGRPCRLCRLQIPSPFRRHQRQRTGAASTGRTQTASAGGNARMERTASARKGKRVRAASPLALTHRPLHRRHRPLHPHLWATTAAMR